MNLYKKREIISNCGSIDIGLEYNPMNRRITVTILECNDLPNQDRGVAPIIQVQHVSHIFFVKFLVHRYLSAKYFIQPWRSSCKCGYNSLFSDYMYVDSKDFVKLMKKVLPAFVRFCKIMNNNLVYNIQVLFYNHIHS